MDITGSMLRRNNMDFIKHHRTYQSIRVFANKLGLMTKKHWADNELTQLVQLSESGKTTKEIANILKRSIGSVYQQYLILGLDHAGNNKFGNCLTDNDKLMIKTYYPIEGLAVKSRLSRDFSDGTILHFVSDNKIKKVKHNNMKKILCIELNQVFESVTEAARALDIKFPKEIGKVANKVPKHNSVHGYHFEWVEENN